MIANYTIVDCRSHTLFEPYTFNTEEEALKWWEGVIKNTVERKQNRVLIMYKDAEMFKTFTLLDY